MNIELLKKNIRRQRCTLGITQDEMARKLGISRQAYNNIELGRTCLVNRKLVKIANQLCISVDQLLLGYEPSPNTESLRKELHEKNEKLAYSEMERREMCIRLEDLKQLLDQQVDYIETLKKVEMYQDKELSRLMCEDES